MDAQVDRDQSKTDKQTPPPRKAVIVRFLRALKRQYHRYEAEAKKRQSDHTENERVMALWTKRVGQFTIALSFIAAASAGISYWSLLAIQGQLDEMRSSGEDTKSLVKAAQDSAKAAQDALSVAEKNSRRQLRAYLAMLHPKLSMGDSQLRFDFSFRNAGQTPAHDVGVAIKATIVDARKRQVIHINRDAPMLFPKFVIGRDLEERSGSTISDGAVSGISA